MEKNNHNCIACKEETCIQKVPIALITQSMDNMNSKIDDVIVTVNDINTALHTYIEDSQKRIEAQRKEYESMFVKKETVKIVTSVLGIVTATAMAVWSFLVFAIPHIIEK